MGCFLLELTVDASTRTLHVGETLGSRNRTTSFVLDRKVPIKESRGILKTTLRTNESAARSVVVVIFGRLWGSVEKKEEMEDVGRTL